MRIAPTTMLLLSLVTLWACGNADNAPTKAPEPTQKPAAEATPKVQGPKPNAQKPQKASPKTGVQKKAPAALDVSGLLRQDDVRQATRFEGNLESARLQGIRPSTRYNSTRLKPPGKSGNYGVALQIWKCDEKEATERFAQFLKTHKEPNETREIGSRSLRSKRHRILHLSWIVPKTFEVITLTCDDRLCDNNNLLALAHRIDARLAASATKAP